MLVLGFDALATGDSFSTAARAVLQSAGTGKGRLATAVAWPGDLPKPNGIEIVVGSPVSVIATSEKKFGAWLFSVWLKERKGGGHFLAAPRPYLVPGGIGAAQEIFDKLKVSINSEKLVLLVD